MTTIDPTTSLGKLRLKVGDISDLPLLPDIVYTQTLADNNDNINSSALTIAGYILAILSQRSHEKLSFVEVWGAEAYNNYLSFLKTVIQNPFMSGSVAYAYAGEDDGTLNPINQFVIDWKGSRVAPTDSDNLHDLARGNTQNEMASWLVLT